MAPSHGASGLTVAIRGAALANGAVFMKKQPWLGTTISTGTTATVTFNLTAAQLASGHVSFYVQDDSAVAGAKLTLTGCCIRKP